VVGDFNHWDVHATPLRRPAAGGQWHAAVKLTPGRHVYAFVVDGRWVPDPAAPRAVDDDFGSPNSVLTVLPVRGST
jgi:1,4-alpha-glucan branching enzyme